MHLEPAGEEDLFKSAMAAQLGGDAEKAIAAYDRIVAANPYNSGARIGKALSFAAIGRHQEAFQDLAALLQESVGERDAVIAKLMEFSEHVKNLIEYPAANGAIDYDALYSQLYRQEALDEKRFYNIGPGAFRLAHWTNIEKTNAAYNLGNVDIEYDILKRAPLPLPDGQAEAFYCSHVINLVREADAEALFSDIFRCLKSGGFFRLVCLDAARLFRAYLDADESFFNWYPLGEGPTLAQKFIDHLAGHRAQSATLAKTTKPSDAEIEALCRSGRPLPEILDALCSEIDLDLMERSPNINVTWWTAEKLEPALRGAGFTQIERSGMGQSRCPVMRDIRHFDQNSVTKASLYVEVQK